MTAGAGRLGNFTGKFCTDGGKMMVKFLCQFRWICYWLSVHSQFSHWWFAWRTRSKLIYLVSITDVYGLHQLINEPKRVTETSQTLTDLIYTNCPDKIVCSGVRHIGISDKNIVFAYRKLSIHGFPRGHCTMSYRNFRKFNLASFRNDIVSHEWDHIHSLSNPYDMWSEWKNFWRLLTSTLHWEKRAFAGVVLLGLRLS